MKKVGCALARLAPADLRPLASVLYADGHPVGGHDTVLLGVHVQVPDGGVVNVGLVVIELVSWLVPAWNAASVA